MKIKLKMEEVKPEVTSEISFAATVDSTSDVGQINLIKEEFSSSKPNLYGGKVEDAVRSRYACMNLKLEPEEDVKPAVTSEISFAAIVDSTLDVSNPNKIRREFSLSEPHSCVEGVEHAIVAVKDEDASIQSLDLQKRSESDLDLKCDIMGGHNDIYFKFEPLVSEELHIKNEVEEVRLDHAIRKSTHVEHFYCGVCDNKFASKRNLQQHLLIHTGDKPYQCNICDYRCIQNSTLQQHMKIHTGDKPFKCSICDYGCKRKSGLQQHMKTHTEDKPFKCSVCVYRCKRNGYLNRHMKTHTGVKPFKCSVCDFRCIRKSDLQQHMKTHTGDKPFKCGVCDYRCIRKNNLQQHMRLHTGEKYQCNICDYKCIRKSNLRRHMNTHTEENSFKCNV